MKCPKCSFDMVETQYSRDDYGDGDGCYIEFKCGVCKLLWGGKLVPNHYNPDEEEIA